MNYKFDVNLTDKDYTDFNIFWMLKSPYGKKQMLKSRLILSVIFILAVLYVLITGEGISENFVFIGIKLNNLN